MLMHKRIVRESTKGRECACANKVGKIVINYI